MSEITDLSETDASNTSLSGVSVAEGCAMANINDAHRATAGFLTRAYNRLTGKYASTGSANAYVLTPGAALAAYVTGERYSFRSSFANTGAATLNISALGAKTIKKIGASGKADLSSGDIQSVQPVTVEYDGTDLILCTPIAAGSGATPSYTDSVTVTSTDAGASAAPLLILDRNSASPAASDTIAELQFKGRDSGGGTDTYATLRGVIIDPVAASEDGRLSLQTMVAGTNATRAYVEQGMVIGSATGGDQGVGTLNATAFYVQGVALATSALKAWAVWGIDGVLDVGFNVDAMTDTGAGDWTVNFTTDFSSVNYVVTTGITLSASNDRFVVTFSKTAGTIRVKTMNAGATVTEVDVSTVSIMAAGTQ